MAIRRYMPDGSVRAVWPKQGAALLREVGSPVRAGDIRVIEEPGPFHEFFYADLSKLAELTGDASHEVCLWPPKLEYADANADEEAYVLRHYVLEGLGNDRERPTEPQAAGPAADGTEGLG